MFMSLSGNMELRDRTFLHVAFNIHDHYIATEIYTLGGLSAQEKLILLCLFRSCSLPSLFSKVIMPLYIAKSSVEELWTGKQLVGSNFLDALQVNGLIHCRLKHYYNSGKGSMHTNMYRAVPKVMLHCSKSNFHSPSIIPCSLYDWYLAVW